MSAYYLHDLPVPESSIFEFAVLLTNFLIYDVVLLFATRRSIDSTVSSRRLLRL